MTPRGRHVGLVGGAAAFVVLIAGVAAVVRSTDDHADVSGVATSTPETTSTIVAATASTPGASTTSTLGSPPRSTVAEPAEPLLLRPTVDESLCRPISANEATAAGVITNLFARSSRNPLPVQVIADPVAGPTGPFAVLMRYFGDDYEAHGSQTVVLADDVTAHLRVYDNGNGQALWDLPDGSQGYLRSRGMDGPAIAAILQATHPRSADDTVPGFDIAAGLPEPHELVDEAMLGEFGAGSAASLQCAVPATGFVYRIGAFVTDSIGEYAYVIDGHPPVEVGRVGPAVVSIVGLDDPARPRLDDIVAADPQHWLDLRGRPDANDLAGGVRVEPIGEGIEVVVAIDPVAPHQVDGDRPSFIMLRLIESGGAPFLEYDMAALHLLDSATAQEVVIDGRTRSLVEPPTPGSVGGVRLSDDVFADMFTAEIRILDGAGEVVQTTGEIELLPE